MNGWLITDAIIKAVDVGQKGWRDNLPSNGLYRLYNEDGELLYIGWSVYIGERIREHVRGRSKNTQHFHTEISTILVTSSENIEVALNHIKGNVDIEKFMIRKLKPKYNLIFKEEYRGNPNWKGYKYGKRPR